MRLLVQRQGFLVGPSKRSSTLTGGSPRPPPRALISPVEERKRAGHKLRLVCLPTAQELDQDLVEELREHVGEVRAGVRMK